MTAALTLAKLQRTLWLARADLDYGDATIVSWYLLEWDATVARLAHRDLHERPKGPAGTDQRAVHLQRFFADAGLPARLVNWLQMIVRRASMIGLTQTTAGEPIRDFAQRAIHKAPPNAEGTCSFDYPFDRELLAGPRSPTCARRRAWSGMSIARARSGSSRCTTT